jgi:hypothetical protein
MSELTKKRSSELRRNKQTPFIPNSCWYEWYVSRQHKTRSQEAVCNLRPKQEAQNQNVVYHCLSPQKKAFLTNLNTVSDPPQNPARNPYHPITSAKHIHLNPDSINQRQHSIKGLLRRKIGHLTQIKYIYFPVTWWAVICHFTAPWVVNPSLAYPIPILICWNWFAGSGW